MARDILYFAHPINTYHTALEAALLAHLAVKWKGDVIVNPSERTHTDEVARMRAADPNVNVMPYFLKLAKTAKNLVVLPFGDGKWGTGIWDEAEAVLDLSLGTYVWVIDHREVAEGITTPTIRFVPKLDPKLRLSVEETRARVRFPDGSSRPYQ